MAVLLAALELPDDPALELLPAEELDAALTTLELLPADGEEVESLLPPPLPPHATRTPAAITENAKFDAELIVHLLWFLNLTPEAAEAPFLNMAVPANRAQAMRRVLRPECYFKINQKYLLLPA